MPDLLPRPCLCLVTDSTVARGELVERVAQAVAGGVDLVQLRDKTLASGQLLDLAAAMIKAIGGQQRFV